MNTAPLPQLLEAGLTGVIHYEMLREVALAAEMSAPDVLNQLARHVALQYAQGAMSFEKADAIMNASFSVVVSEAYWVDHDRTIPEAVLQVYEAFDAGEFCHPGDAEEVDPELKYTKPLVSKFLAEEARGA